MGQGRVKNEKFIQVNLQLLKKLDNSTYRLFCILLAHSNSNGECFPSIRKISNEYNISDKTIQKAINKLVELKIITKINRKTVNGKNTSNLYRINPEFLVGKKSKRKRIIEILPDWFDKEFNVKKPSKEKLKEMEDLLEEFKDE